VCDPSQLSISVCCGHRHTALSLTYVRYLPFRLLSSLAGDHGSLTYSLLRMSHGVRMPADASTLTGSLDVGYALPTPDQKCCFDSYCGMQPVRRSRTAARASRAIRCVAAGIPLFTRATAPANVSLDAAVSQLVMLKLAGPSRCTYPVKASRTLAAAAASCKSCAAGFCSAQCRRLCQAWGLCVIGALTLTSAMEVQALVSSVRAWL